MNAGKMDRHATIYANSPERTSVGGVKGAWEPIATVWCAKIESKGSTGTNSGREDATIEQIYEMRYLAAVQANMRIKVDHDILEITNVAEIGRRDGLRITAKVRSK